VSGKVGKIYPLYHGLLRFLFYFATLFVMLYNYLSLIVY